MTHLIHKVSIKKYTRLIIVVTIFVLASGWYYLNATLNKSESNTLGNSFYETNLINKGNVPAGFYSTEGYVVNIYQCTCPQGATCKCAMPFITISRNNNHIDTYPYADSDLTIYTQNPSLFELNKKYTFLIKLTKRSTGGDYIELVHFEPI